MQFLQKKLQKSETFIMSAFVLSGLSETFCQSQEFAFLSNMQKRVSNSTGKIIVKKKTRLKTFQLWVHFFLAASRKSGQLWELPGIYATLLVSCSL